MNKETKTTKHILCEKAPIFAMILAAVLAMLILSIPGLLGLSDVVSNLASSVLAVLFLIAYTKWFAPEFKGVFKTSALATGVIFLWLPFLFKLAGSYFLNVVDYGFYFKPTMLALAMAFAAGFFEETIFRGVTVPIGMRYIRSEKRVSIIVLFTALVFGLLHVGNVINGANVTMGIIQGIATIFAGLLFVAVFLRTGNILIPIIMHGVYDYMCFVTDASLDNGIMVGETVTIGLILAVLVDVIAGIWGLYLIRPAKRAFSIGFMKALANNPNSLKLSEMNFIQALGRDLILAGGLEEIAKLVIIVVILLVYELVVLLRCKKKTAELCGLSTLAEPNYGRYISC